MQISNFNEPGLGDAGNRAVPPPEGHVAGQENPGDAAGRQQTETALLHARIEHLELVVETARSLMTSNQERLLRRLHDLPQEMMALTARMARMGTAAGAAGDLPDEAAAGLALKVKRLK